MTLRLAFTGTGYIARIHALAAQKIDDVTLTAVVNHRADSRQAFAAAFDIPRQFTTIAELLADGDVDAVSINTPNYLHAPQAIAALEAGIHVLVEKPMAMNAAEAAAMLPASRASAAVLMVAHCWRFDTDVLWLRQQIANGRIGRVIRTRGHGVHTHWGPGGWFTQAQFAGGGALADMGIHAVDTVRFLLGDPVPLSVYARIGTYYGSYDVDDTGLIVVNWDNGVTSLIESGWWQPHADGPEAATQLYGTAGFGELFPTHLSLPDPATDSVAEVDPGFAFPRAEHCPQEMYDRQMAAFVDRIRGGVTAVPDGVTGLVNMQIVDAAYASARSGQVVAVP